MNQFGGWMSTGLQRVLPAIFGAATTAAATVLPATALGTLAGTAAWTAKRASTGGRSSPGRPMSSASAARRCSSRVGTARFFRRHRLVTVGPATREPLAARSPMRSRASASKSMGDTWVGS